MNGASLTDYSYVQFGVYGSSFSATINLVAGTTNAILGNYHNSGDQGCILSYASLTITTSDNNPYSASLNIIPASRNATNYAIYLPSRGNSFSISNGNVLIMVDAPSSTNYGIQCNDNIYLTRGNIKIYSGTLNQSSTSYMLNINNASYYDKNLYIGKNGDSDDLLKLDCLTGASSSGYNVGIRLNDANICYVYSGEANIETGLAGGSSCGS